MNVYSDYFPTKAYKISEKRLGLLLSKEMDRLNVLASLLKRKSAIGPDNLKEQIPYIIDFAKAYHQAYSLYLKAVLPQQQKKITCKPSCGNCCHHYPMSVEPFELIYLYMNLRNRNDFLVIMENCQMRSSLFNKFFNKRLSEGKTEDSAEDEALHDYFSNWVSCPFSSPLGDCQIYPLRPVSCRMYFSETESKYCTPKYLQTKKNNSYIIYMPDSIEESLYDIAEHYEELNLPNSYFGGLLSMNLFEGILG